ncbi:porin [Massilia sp. erpn]|uniref:porin n=1 Tax=Massilia sp. erpn TaxID=2738142 RepID=UPI002102B3E2|nr:porin [Massilia sp. erpn]UTY56289.1 porin [Massilia sp. erpn]
MKKTLISIAVLGAMSSAAFAQSNVTIYGIVDAGIVAERGGKSGSVNKVTSGVANASRLGFKGTEDLGGGLQALFVLEGGIKADTGESDKANSIANRQSFVGLRSKEAGTLTLGRQYTPFYNALSQVGDPFAAGLAGTAKNLFPVKDENTRNSNAVVYATPAYNGVSAEFFYGFGEKSANSTQRQVGASLNYANGPLNARLAYNNRNNDDQPVLGGPVAEKETGRNTLLAVNYDFQVAKAFFMYSDNKGLNSAALASPDAYNQKAPVASTKSADTLVGVTVPVGGAGKFIASYINKNDKTAFNQDANQIAVGYTYDLSKRTTTYVAYAKIKNKNGAGYTVGNNSEAGTGDKAFNIGVRHSF